MSAFPSKYVRIIFSLTKRVLPIFLGVIGVCGFFICADIFFGPGVREAHAATSGQMTLYFQPETVEATSTVANAIPYGRFNALTLTTLSTTTLNASAVETTKVATSSLPCISTKYASHAINEIVIDDDVAGAAGTYCMGTFFSMPVGQSISISTSDTNSLYGEVYGSNTGGDDAVTGYIVEFYQYDGTTFTKFGVASSTDLGTGALTNSKLTVASTTPKTSVTLAATDRIVAVVSVKIYTADASSGTSDTTSFRFGTPTSPSFVRVAYTAVTPNKPNLTGSKDDDFTVQTSSNKVDCSNAGITYNTKWTCITPSGSTLGSIGVASSTEWIILTDKEDGTLGTNFGTNPENTYVYQTVDTNTDGDGLTSTVMNSTGNVATGNFPNFHGGLLLWASNTDYLIIEVGTTTTASTSVIINNSGNTSATTTVAQYNRVWLGWSKTDTAYQAQYATTTTAGGPVWNNLGNAINHATTFTRMGMTAYAAGINTEYSAAFEYFDYAPTPLPASSFTQLDYRWYQNIDAIQPTTALAVEDTAYTLTSTSSPIRLRTNVTVGTQKLATSTTAFKPQYAWSTAGPWTDVSDPWYSANWLYRKKITLNPSKVTVATSSFPILVDLTDSNLASNAQSDGDDILFTDQEGNKLDHEIEKYTSTTGTLTAWVRSAIGPTTEFYMYYGNAGTSSEATTTGVWRDTGSDWSSSFKGVWHMSNNASSTNGFTESTANNNVGTGNGGPSLASTTGKIARAYSFDGTNDYVGVTDTAGLNLDGTNKITLEGWAYLNNTSQDYPVIIARQNNGTGEYTLQFGNTTDKKPALWLNVGSWAAKVQVLTALNINQWYHIVGTYDGSTAKIYIDGVLDNSASLTGTFIDAGDPPQIGLGNTSYFSGTLDELRISNVGRDADWILTEYNNQSATSTFYTVGTQETNAVSGTSNVWQFANNASVTDGTTTTAVLLSTSEVNESYEEASSTLANPTAIAVNQEGEWDFALNPKNATSTTYYFRMVTSTTTAFSLYSNYPTITISGGDPTYTQRNYRWFLNTDNVQPGSAKGAPNGTTTDVDNGNLHRLRMDLSVATSNLSANGQIFDLQYRAAGSGCDITGTWINVGGATSTDIWIMYNNPGVVDAATLTSALLNSSNVLQNYNESTTFINPSAINSGQAGEWDWGILNNGAVGNTTYCFRIAKIGGTALDVYTNYPKLTTSGVTSGRGGGGSTLIQVPIETITTGGTAQGGGTTTQPATPSESPTTGGGGSGGGGDSAFTPSLLKSFASIIEGFLSLIRLFKNG